WPGAPCTGASGAPAAVVAAFTGPGPAGPAPAFAAPAPSPDASPPPAGEASSACSVAASVGAAVPPPAPDTVPPGTSGVVGLSGVSMPTAVSAAAGGVAAPAVWARPSMFQAWAGSIPPGRCTPAPETTWNAVGNCRSSRFARITAGLYSVLTTA